MMNHRIATILLAALTATSAGSAMGTAFSIADVVPPEGSDGGSGYANAFVPEPEERWDGDANVPPEPACEEAPTFVDGIGFACQTERGLWKIFMDDGSYILSHGGDPREPGQLDTPRVEALPGTPGLDGSNMPECWADGNYRFRAVYAYQASAGSSYTTQVPTIRTRINETNYHFDTRAHGTSWHHEFRFACLDSTRVTVSNAGSVSCADAAACSFSAITNKVKSWSWGNNANEYYVIFWKGAYSYCGQGGIEGDESDSANNANNNGPQYSVIDDGCWSVNTILHEMTHNMGGAQYSAPESSGSGWHCNDGYDILCYSDGGDKSNYRTTACATSTPKIYDCNRNTYCDNSVTAGEWLDTHWNICDAYNRFATKAAV